MWETLDPIIQWGGMSAPNPSDPYPMVGPFFTDYIGGDVAASSGANAGFMGWQTWGVTWGNQGCGLSTVVLQQAVFQNDLLTGG